MNGTRLSRRSKITLAGAQPMHPGRLRRSSLTYRRVCSLLAPCHPGASAALFAQVIFSRLPIGLCAITVTAVAAPRPAHALDGTASAGLGLGRWDNWSGDAHTSTNIPDWQLAASFAGQPFRPGLLDWQAGASYTGLRDYETNLTSNRNAYGYRLNTAMLSSTNVPITLSASRVTSSFATETNSPQTGGTISQTGTTETSMLTSSLVLRAPQLPMLRLQGSWVNANNTPIGGVSTNLDTKIVNAGLSQSLGTQTYAVDYASTWNSGNFNLNNYRTDYLNAQFISAPRADLMVHFRESYLLRTPTNDAAQNPRYDDNTVTAGVVFRPKQRWTTSLDYSFHHALVSAGAPTLDQTSHALSETTTFRLRPDLQLFATGGAGYTYEQLQEASMRAGSQSLGGGVSWQYKRGRMMLLTSGNGQLAALETSGQAFALGYGVGASEGITHARDRLNLGLTYSIAYSDNAAGVGGSNLTQMVYGSADGLVGRNLQLRSTLNYAQTRRQDPLLGEYQNRTLTFIARAAMRRLRDSYSLDLTLGESEGLAGSLAPSNGPPSPTILPSSYNTRSKFATLQATQTMLRGKLAIIEVGRVMSIEMPQQPSQHEESAWLSLRYALGQIYISVEDRLSRGGTAGPALMSNLFMLRLSRGFGVHF